MKRKMPKSWKNRRMRSIKKGVQRTPCIYFRVRCLLVELPQEKRIVLPVDLQEPSML